MKSRLALFLENDYENVYELVNWVCFSSSLFFLGYKYLSMSGISAIISFELEGLSCNM